MIRILVALALIAAVAAFTWWWKRREGRFTEADGRFDRVSLGIGQFEKPCAAIVEFYADHCAPCKVVEARLTKIAETVCDLKIIKVDAGERLDLADRYNVKRIPTMFVTDEDLKIVWRASGVPTEDAIMKALLGPE
ncbi:MAG TPA: thioredoxin family protein, partial [Actinomycetota bacterium]|nr:thioredoxin family protein [Actinomycetota bacterium]